MGTRLERVVLDLQDDFSTKMARAAASTALLNKELKGLDGKRVSRELDDTARSVDRVGNNARRGGPDIDRFSGRLRLLRDVSVTLGPALIPLTAGTIPALTGALNGLGAAAGGIGVTVLAMSGLGDAMKALNDYQLEPTADNLAKVRIEMEKLGPSGAHFVRFLDSLEPQLRELQLIARAGLFPGVEDGINSLLERLPQVRRIVADLSLGMGELAREAGENLGGERFRDFFRFLETDARPTLEAFGRATGNVVEGIANLMVAFAPLSRDFTTGLEDATRAFARWSRGLDRNQSFQEFVDYVRQSAPQARDFIVALVQALGGLVRAAAPLGSAVLPALTALAKAFSAIANSPIGPPLYTAAAALIAFNRAATLTSRSVASVQAGLRRLGTESTTAQSRMSVLFGRGGVVFAGAAATGLLADSINRIKTDDLERNLQALEFGNVTDQVDKVIDSLEELEATRNKVDLGEIVTVGGLFGDTSLDKFADNVDQVDQKLAQMVESGQKVAASHIFEKIVSLAQGQGVDPSRTAARFDAYALALKNAEAAAVAAQGPMRGLGRELHSVNSEARDMVKALSELNGWFDKRQAIRDYRQAIRDLKEGLKDGFSRDDVEQIDQVGRSIIEVANQIQSPALRTDFLAGARKSLEKVAEGAGPKAQKALERVLAKMDELDVAKADPRADLDDEASPKLDKLDIHLRRTNQIKVTPKVGADTSAAEAALRRVETFLERLNGRTVTTYIRTVATRNNLPAPASADGTTVPKTGRGYADRHLYLLADGEEVVSNRYGQADRWRPLLKAINANRMADGGTAGGRGFNSAFDPGGPSHWMPMVQALNESTKGLKALKRELEASEKALDRERKKRDEIADKMQALSESVSSGLRSDIFAGPSSAWAASMGIGGINSILQSDIGRGQQFQSLVGALQDRGLRGGALQALLQQAAQTQNLGLLQQFASGSASQIAQFQALFNQRERVLAAAGQSSGQAVFGAAYAAQTKVLEQTRDEVKGLRQDVKRLEKAIDRHDKNNQKGHANSAHATNSGFQAVGDARRRGRRGPR